MGNCIRKQFSTQWAGEDWAANSAATPFSDDKIDANSMNLEAKSRETSPAAAGPEGKEVKIKITKKQLEQMLIKADIQGLSLQQILAKLIDGDDRFETRRPSWTPALQSIPE